MAKRIAKSASECRQRQPKDLGEIELDLQNTGARHKRWYLRGGRQISEKKVLEKLNEWTAVRGWVVEAIEIRDCEGPDFHIYFAYEHDGALHSHYLKVGYDGMHWALGSPEHWEWFHSKMHSGSPLTLLVNPQDSKDCIIFGQLETFDSDRKFIAQ